jgi:hypothetical protein
LVEISRPTVWNLRRGQFPQQLLAGPVIGGVGDVEKPGKDTADIGVERGHILTESN